jgi:hypothetical protein
MKINHNLEQDFNTVIWSMKSRKDAALVKKLYARVQQVLGIYESLLDSKVNAAINEATEAQEEKETEEPAEKEKESDRDENK